MLTIYSGSQTGVDSVGLVVAERLGLKTGGYVTKGNRTKTGYRPDLIERFGLTELDTTEYKPRTWKNVEHSDLTIIIACYWKSPGTKCTLRAIEKYLKPHLLVEAFDDSAYECIDRNVQFFLDHNVKIINVAGHAEESNPGISRWAFDYLFKLFSKYLAATSN